MIRLGGGDRVEAWVDEYRVQLTPDADPGDRVTTDNWRGAARPLRPSRDWTSLFRRAMLDQGWRVMYWTPWWDRLLPGAAASATHGLIRTAHAVRNLAGGDDTDRCCSTSSLTVSRCGLRATSYCRATHGSTAPGRSMTPLLDCREPTSHARSSWTGSHGSIGDVVPARGRADAIDDWGPADAPVVVLDELIARSARILLAVTDGQ